MLNRPAGSATQIGGAQNSLASLRVDQPGRYQVQLLVNDGKLNCAPATLVLDLLLMQEMPGPFMAFPTRTPRWAMPSRAATRSPTPRSGSAPPREGRSRTLRRPAMSTRPGAPLASTTRRSCRPDSEGPKHVPNACIARHGGSLDSSTNKVIGAALLPFVVADMKFSTQPGFTAPIRKDPCET